MISGCLVAIIFLSPRYYDVENDDENLDLAFAMTRSVRIGTHFGSSLLHTQYLYLYADAASFQVFYRRLKITKLVKTIDIVDLLEYSSK